MTPELRAVARRQAGCFRRSQALRCGVDAGVIERYLLDGEWLRLHPDVYVCAGTPVTDAMRWWAAVLAVGEPVALAGRTAGLAHSLDAVPAAVRPELAVPRRRQTPDVAGVVVRRVVDTDWSVVRHRGLPLTPLPVTIRDLAADARHEVVRDVVQHALRRRRVTFEALADTLGRGRAGSAALRRVLEEVAPGYQVKWERQLHRAVRARGVNMQPQLPVVAPDGRRALLDLGLAEIRFGVEIDGFLNHMARFAADRKRARMLAVELGWTVAHYAVEELVANLAGVADEIVEHVRRRQQPATA